MSCRAYNESINSTDLGLHLSGLLWVHGQYVLVMADGVLAVLVLGADVPPEGLQDAVGLWTDGAGGQEGQVGWLAGRSGSKTWLIGPSPFLVSGGNLWVSVRGSAYLGTPAKTTLI